MYPSKEGQSYEVGLVDFSLINGCSGKAEMVTELKKVINKVIFDLQKKVFSMELEYWKDFFYIGTGYLSK